MVIIQPDFKEDRVVWFLPKDIKIKAFFALFIAVWLLSGAVLRAQNQVLLDALVREGYLTQQDVKSIVNETVVVNFSQASTKILSVSGLIHSQYDYVATDDDVAGVLNPKSTNRFRMRRVGLALPPNSVTAGVGC